jgi:hypothetical protein
MHVSFARVIAAGHAITLNRPEAVAEKLAELAAAEAATAKARQLIG